MRMPHLKVSAAWEPLEFRRNQQNKTRFTSVLRALSDELLKLPKTIESPRSTLASPTAPMRRIIFILVELAPWVGRYDTRMLEDKGGFTISGPEYKSKCFLLK